MIDTAIASALMNPVVVEVQYSSQTESGFSNLIHLSQKQGSGWLSTSFILANIILGVGLLNFPSAYSDAGGLPTAIGVQMLCLVFILISLFFLIQCADFACVKTYQDVVYTYMGSVAACICNVMIFVHNFGTCVTFMVILADQLNEMMLFFYGPGYCHHWFMNRTFTLSVASLFMLPLSLYSRIDSFKFISVIGVVSTLYITFLVIWKYFTYEPTNLHLDWAPHQWMDIFRVIPVICFSFEGHIEAVPLFACLKEKNQKEFFKVTTSALAMCLLIYTLVGSLAYLTVGSTITSDLVDAYFPPDIPVIIGTAIIGIKAIVTYPGIMFCSRMVMDETFEHYFNRCGLTPSVARIVESVILFVLALTLAHLVPTIGSVISVLGGSAAVFIFVFPGACIFQLEMYSKSTMGCLKKFTGLFMIVIGVFLAVTTTVQASMTLEARGPRLARHICLD